MCWRLIAAFVKETDYVKNSFSTEYYNGKLVVLVGLVLLAMGGVMTKTELQTFLKRVLPPVKRKFRTLYKTYKNGRLHHTVMLSDLHSKGMK